MRRLKLVCLASMLAVAAGGMAAAAAEAESTPLPDIHTALPGETYPLNLGGHLAGASRLENTDGAFELGAKEFSVLLSIRELTSLGEANLVFLGIEEVKEHHKCHTAGASETNGEVAFPDAEWHLVYTSLSPSEPLEVGALILFSRFIVTCNAGLFELTLTGPWLTRANVPTPGEGDSTDVQIVSHCPMLGVQELPYYYNDTLTRIATTLLVNISGSGNTQACQEIEGTILLTPETGSVATMFSVLF
jgi:hypothetical protein